MIYRRKEFFFTNIGTTKPSEPRPSKQLLLTNRPELIFQELFGKKLSSIIKLSNKRNIYCRVRLAQLQQSKQRSVIARTTIIEKRGANARLQKKKRFRCGIPLENGAVSLKYSLTILYR